MSSLISMKKSLNPTKTTYVEKPSLLTFMQLNKKFLKN